MLETCYAPCMERHSIESTQQISFRELGLDSEEIQKAASLVTMYSWGKNYPLSPLSEIERAERREGAYIQDKLVGFASVGKGFSPDGRDNDALWLAHAVVNPEYRRQGIFEKLYDAQMSYAQLKDERVLSCTDSPIIAEFFLRRGWQKIRDTKDEAGDSCSVFEFRR